MFGSNSMTQQMNSMEHVGIVFGMVNRLAVTTSAVDWKLYRKNTDARRRYAYDATTPRVEVTSHAALDLWNKPNPFSYRQLFVEGFQQHLDLTGEAYWVLLRNSALSTPLEMWYVRPDKMEPIPHPDKYLAGYIYYGPDGEQIPLMPDEVIQLKMPNPGDQYRGLGPIQSVLTSIDALRFSAAWNRNFFLNDARPGGIIELPDSLDDIQFREFRDRWEEQHRGVTAAGRVAILEHGGKWTENQYTMRDMQFAELRHVSRDEIMESFGFPKSELGIVEDVNRANAIAGSTVFAQRLNTPRLDRIKGALNHFFLPNFVNGENLEFDYCNSIPDDREADDRERGSKADAFKTLVEAGVDPDEAAAIVGYSQMKMASVAPAVAPQPALMGGN